MLNQSQTNEHKESFKSESDEMAAKKTSGREGKPKRRKEQNSEKKTTAKSAQDVKPSYTLQTSTRQQKTGKPKTKMKSSLKENVAPSKSLCSSRTTSRSLPAIPSTEKLSAKALVSNSVSGDAKKAKPKLPSASELREIPVNQTSCLYSYATSGSGLVRSDPDLILGLPQHYDLLSMSSKLSDNVSNRHMFKSVESLRPGSILDGSSTHRSISGASVYSAVTLDAISIQQDQSSVLMSPRPLPVLPER